MLGSLAEVFFCSACKLLIERWFSGGFRFAKMAPAGSGVRRLSRWYHCRDFLAKIANIMIIDLIEEISVAHFSLTDLSNRSGEVVEAAFRGPVEITRRGKRKFMLLTAEDYDRLVSAADTRRAFHADDAPEGVAAMMLAALAKNDKT